MASNVCFLHHHINAIPSTSLLHGHGFHRQVPSQLKPSKLQVLVKAQKQDVEDHDPSNNFDAIFSRRGAISVLVGSAALATQLSPGNAALYGAPEPAMAADPVIKVAAMYGSLNKCSRSRGLIKAAVDISKQISGMDIQVVEIGDLPLLNPDDAKKDPNDPNKFTFPPNVQAFRDKIQDADCYLFVTTEYNYAVTGAMKNAIDWASGWEGGPQNAFNDKAVAIMSAGYEVGGGYAQQNMRQMGVRLNLHFVNDPKVFVYLLPPSKPFDENCNLKDDSVKKQIKNLLLALQAFTLRLRK